MYKFFVNNNQINNNKITIIGTDVNHIINVLRLKIDDEIQICDQDTSVNYLVTINSYDDKKIECSILTKIDSDIELKFDLDIYQGLPKADKMELIIQKTTEIGVNKIIPVAMERCVVKLNQKDIIKKTERWQKIAEVAAKQSKRDRIPKIENTILFSNCIDNIKEYDLFIIAYEEEQELTLRKTLQEFKTDYKKTNEHFKIGALIGPEGGIDPKEIEIIKTTNAKIVTLGKRILRTETAPIVIASNITYELDE